MLLLITNIEGENKNMYNHYPFNDESINGASREVPQSAEYFDRILHYSDDLLEQQSQFFNRRHSFMENKNNNKNQNNNKNKFNDKKDSNEFNNKR